MFELTPTEKWEYEPDDDVATHLRQNLASGYTVFDFDTPALELPPVPVSVLYAKAHGAAIVAERRYGVNSAQYRQATALASGVRKVWRLDGVLGSGVTE